MIDALSMQQVSYKTEPHPSHTMGEWESTLVACASNDRFGSERCCKKCSLRDVKAGGAGSRYFDEGLETECSG